ncbi:MAG: hypothetical protein E7Z86_04870 [Methanosphaera stadtmanae]|nr:hypothetical protein [Methanosphaera stadtmanae]
MKDLLNQIQQQLQKGNNILVYKQELYKLYEKRDKSFKAVYISTPKKGKTAIENIIKQVDSEYITKNKTISKLIEEILEKTKDEQIIIYINYFEQLSQRELVYYKELESSNNIKIVANIQEDRKFIDEEFLKKFVLLNDEYNDNRIQSINITYTILFIMAILVFLLFLRLQLSMIGYIVSALWFSFLMYRTFYYITK